MTPSILWWGRSDHEYSRNRTLRGLLADMGAQVIDFVPRHSRFAGVQATFKQIMTPDLIWVPAFRQRDLLAAAAWGRKRGAPVLFDPLISAYDKQVEERRKLSPTSRAARRLLTWERRLFSQADLVLADTEAHAEYFESMLDVPAEKIATVMVGADEEIFRPAPMPDKDPDGPYDVLFFGSFIPLQGPKVIAQAARAYDGPKANWTMVGDGQLVAECRRIGATVACLQFEPWLEYTKALPRRIAAADLLLGVFGTTPKAGRVIPNKVFQALAVGRPLVTRQALTYPLELRRQPFFASGISWVAPGDPGALAEAVASCLSDRVRLRQAGRAARTTYERWFSAQIVREQLVTALERLNIRTPSI